MKFCADHWAKLKASIEARGLSQLIPKGGEEAARRLVDQFENGEAHSNFDPLMAAHNAIVSNALGACGPILLTNKEDGSDHCPICFLLANCSCGKLDACPFAGWIDRAADDSFAAAKELGLIATLPN